MTTLRVESPHSLSQLLLLLPALQPTEQFHTNGWGQDSCQGSLDNIMKQLQTQDRFAFSQMLEKVMAGAMKVRNSATIAQIDMHSSNDAAAQQVSLPL